MHSAPSRRVNGGAGRRKARGASRMFGSLSGIGDAVWRSCGSWGPDARIRLPEAGLADHAAAATRAARRHCPPAAVRGRRCAHAVGCALIPCGNAASRKKLLYSIGCRMTGDVPAAQRARPPQEARHGRRRYAYRKVCQLHISCRVPPGRRLRA